MFKKMFKNKKRNIVIVVIVLILIMIIVNINSAKNKLNSMTETPTDTIERRTLVSSISATGNITSSEIKNIATTLTGMQIKTVNVEVGDVIYVGDVICTFDTKNIQESLNSAQRDLDRLNEQGNIGILNARRNLSDAINARDTMNGAKAELDSAVYNFNVANAILDSKQTELLNKTIEEAMLKVISDANPGDTVAETNYETAKAEREQLEIEVAGEQAKVDGLALIRNSKQAIYEKLAGASSAVESAESAVRSAELSAGTSGSAYETQIRNYKEQLGKGRLTATTSGVVTAVNVSSGDIYMGSPIATIEGDEDFIIEAEIDQYDISDIKTGMKVFIKTDATRKEELQGVVTYTAPKATAVSPMQASSGGVTYTVKIAISTPNERLRLGMTARLSIVTDSKEDVLSVPYDAVYERDDKTRYIKVETEDGEEEIDVTVGMESNYYVEIISNKIKEGMTVILPTIIADNSIQNLVANMGASGGM